MTNILLIDDTPYNNTVFNLLIEEYMENNNITQEEYYIEETTNAKSGYALAISGIFDIIFLDIMMPELDGLELLRQLREIKTIKQPIVVMATALGDAATIEKERLFGANAYMVKPISLKVVTIMFDKYLKQLSEGNFNPEEPFEFDEFIDFDDEDHLNDSLYNEKEEYSQQMQKYNESHLQISAKEFLEEYDENELENIVYDLEDLDNFIKDHLEALYEDNLQSETKHIITTLEKYASFLNYFVDFQELSSSITLLSRQLENTHYSTMDIKSRDFIVQYIKSILKDLQEWKTNVFIEQNAIDIFYLNASLLSNCLQLGDFIKNTTSKS